MAVPTGSGTETLHSHWFEDVDNMQTLIYGAQHHVYTVKRIIILRVVQGQLWYLHDSIFRWGKPMFGMMFSLSMDLSQADQQY